MRSRPSHDHPPETDDCPRVRLTQGQLAAVDACRCGMLQLHLGALTIRMTPSALEELERTLATALREYRERFGETADLLDGFLPGGRRPRGAA